MEITMTQTATLPRRSASLAIALHGLGFAPASAPPDGSDVDLLSLGKRFDPLYRRWTACKAAEAHRQFEFEMAVESVLGTKLVDVPDAPGNALSKDDQRRRNA
jgi:hypothetical protein